MSQPLGFMCVCVRRVETLILGAAGGQSNRGIEELKILALVIVDGLK